jgi:hypothetical protein
MPTELESRDQWSRMQYGRWLRSLAGVATIGLGLLTSPVFAQQPEPDYFAGSADAQPLTAADAQSPPPQAEVLRWKTPQPITNPYVDRSVVKASITLSAPQRNEEDAPAPVAARSARPSAGGGWNKSRISGHQGAARPVRLAGHDPFSDPFGDRVAQSVEPALQGPAHDGEIEVIQIPGPGAADNLPEPMPMPPAAGDDDARTYRPAQCDAWEANCERFKDWLRADPLNAISMNITPLYSASPVEGESSDEYRKRDLQVAPSRTWRSRTGELLATGRLGNVEYGRVVIVDDAGKVVARPSIDILGKDEICFITFHWQVPYHCYANPELVPRNWVASTFTYQASGLCHKPLYFEEVQLERYGHTAGPIKQPLLSGAHFFLNIAVLPYKMGINPPCECQYALGYYRPGSCAPWHIPPVPISVRGALAEAGAWVGGIYIIP